MRKQKNKKLCWILVPIMFMSLIAHKVQNASADIFADGGKKVSFSNVLLKDSVKNQSRELEASTQPVNREVLLYPGGQPIGVRLNTKGVLVVALSDLDNDGSKIVSPGALAGIEIGDSILSINGEHITSSEQVATIINSCEGKSVRVEIQRKSETFIKEIKPVKVTTDKSYKLGLWVRDSTAGVGTLTFYDENSGIFAALGHPITDMDTGTILSINTGEILPSTINSVVKGTRGNPGELKGIFVSDNAVLGSINKNTSCGIIGRTDHRLINKFNKPMPAALRSEVKEGPAQILTTIFGDQPELYDIQIQKLLNQDAPDSKSMVICITDQKLLSKTGGIVQGMSGSPIIQNGKIVGAVTHVLINRPEVGYGIYIEWMLKEAQIF